MFALKKIISSFITLPGIFIVYLISTGIYGLIRKSKALSGNIIAGILLYLLSISPTADCLIGLAETGYTYRGEADADVIILLGGGIVEGAPDFSGTGVPYPDMMMRVVDAVRLHKKHGLPIVVSGGAASGGQKEADVAERLLSDLGVPDGHIIKEDKSRDTVENAYYVKKIFERKGYGKGLLVTSAYHIRRAEYLFRKAGIDVIPYPSGFLSKYGNKIEIYDFLPHYENLRKSSLAVREFAGLTFYRMKYSILP